MRPKKGKRWIQGVFKPVHPEKYAGDPTSIIYRSSWELRVFSRLDLDDEVIAWGSEECVVRYYDPVTKRSRRYFPDLVVKYRDGRVEMWEIKPSDQQVRPEKGKKSQKTFVKQATTWMTNQAKWEAAKTLCESWGWEFRVLNEMDLGIRSKRKRAPARGSLSPTSALTRGGDRERPQSA